jgi:hypothetical protein
MEPKVIGVIGYSTNSCKTDYARQLVKEGIREAMQLLGLDPSKPVNQRLSYALHDFAVCSGLTDLGIPSLAYAFAKEQGLQTIGIACAKATEHSCFPVDHKVIVGQDWGDESETFLEAIDALVQVGGGLQSNTEAAAWKTTGKPYVYRALTREGTNPDDGIPV